MWIATSLMVLTLGMVLYYRLSVLLSSFCLLLMAVLLTIISFASPVYYFFLWLMLLPILIVLNVLPLRQKKISYRVLTVFRRIMPRLSATEKEALEAGTVWWEKELFSGKPNWDFFHRIPPARLTAEEQAFLDGPVHALCRQIDDWDITHRRLDLPPALWDFLKRERFFGLLIPKAYGGHGFSPFLHSEVVAKIGALSCTVASTVTVPNSLGPAELILSYGTPEQKEYYLPRLARGEEIPCFALTGIETGSDAANMQDVGIVGYHQEAGQKVLGFWLTLNKRYITLAPVATVIGVAFRLFDPEHLLGQKKEIGITCALIHRDLPGLCIGQRHFPLNIPFQNGPIQAENVFVPLSAVIGGQNMVGQGWRMIMQCLAEGRSISLPSISAGSARMAAVATGAYTRIRQQFGCSLSEFEGIQAPMGRMAGLTYALDATRKMAAAAVSAGDKSAVFAAIVKYHITELARGVFAADAMDIHGGKSICMGPKNYLGRNYQAAPIAITVEGANILTRSLIIFGQGSIRCHPFIYAELKAARLTDPQQRLVQFDAALFGHFGFVASNVVRALVLTWTRGRLVKKQVRDETARYYQLVEMYSPVMALWADVAMMGLGGRLKRLENVSARLGDMLSMLVLTTAVLKRYEHEGRQKEDLPLVHWSCCYFLHQLEQAMVELMANFPLKWLRPIMRILTLPYGRCQLMPSDALTSSVAALMSDDTGSRPRLVDNGFLEPTPGNPIGRVEQVFHQVIAAEPHERQLREAVKKGLLTSTLDYWALIDEAEQQQVLTASAAHAVRTAYRGRLEVIGVDAFDQGEL